MSKIIPQGYGQYTTFTYSSIAAFQDRVEITFSNNISLNGIALSASNYLFNSIIGANSTAVSVSSLGNVLTVYITKQTNGETYNISLPIIGINDVFSNAYSGPYLISYVAVAVGAGLASVSTNDCELVNVLFTEWVNPIDALDIANYSIPGLTICSAIKITDLNYHLVTSEQTAGTLYTLTISTIRDIANNPPS
jgi:hypothetical protein